MSGILHTAGCYPRQLLAHGGMPHYLAHMQQPTECRSRCARRDAVDGRISLGAVGARWAAFGNWLPPHVSLGCHVAAAHRPLTDIATQERPPHGHGAWLLSLALGDHAVMTATVPLPAPRRGLSRECMPVPAGARLEG